MFLSLFTIEKLVNKFYPVQGFKVRPLSKWLTCNFKTMFIKKLSYIKFYIKYLLVVYKVFISSKIVVYLHTYVYALQMSFSYNYVQDKKQNKSELNVCYLRQRLKV